MKINFKNKILFVGYGAVSKCALPILLKEINVPLENITVIDFEDKSKEIEKFTEKGLKFFKERITPDNLDKILSKYLHSGDLLIDLAWNIDCNEIVNWCHKNEILYINASVEEWDSISCINKKCPFEKL